MISPSNSKSVPYFDHNATTPLLAAARAALIQAMDETWHNPSSPYRDAAGVHRRLQEARARVADFLGRTTEEIAFTSGATEANNAVISWAAREASPATLFIASPTEHPSVLEPLEMLPTDSVRHLTVDAEGRVDVEHCRELLADGSTALVACMAANNETGVLGPVVEIAERCAAHRVPFLCDASQWIGRLPAGMLPPGAFVVGCAHKFGGPKGVGFLAIPATARGYRGALGGEQEHGYRAGTENYPAIAAMVAALEYAEKQSAEDRRERTQWRDAFTREILAQIPDARVNGAGAGRLWNTVSLTMPRFDNTRWVTRLDKHGFQVSTGSACATGSNAPSHVLAAMGLTPEATRRTIRVSAGWESGRNDWLALQSALLRVWQELQTESSGDAGDVISI